MSWCSIQALLGRIQPKSGTRKLQAMDRHFTTRAVYSPRPILVSQAVFYFYIFQFRFLQKYIFIFEIYRNIPRPPCCRAAGTWSPRQGLFCKKFHGNFALKPLEDRSPDSGAAGPMATRQRGGRPRPPGSGATASPGPI